MSEGGYENVPEFKKLSSDAPLGMINAWIPRHVESPDDNLDLPDGWLPCDGRMIENGPWSGGMTPNLNGDGRFLRGGDLDSVLTMQEDSFQDHDHPVFDNGHTHSDNGHSHDYVDKTAEYDMGHGSNAWTDNDQDQNYYSYPVTRTTNTGKADITSSYSGITIGNSKHTKSGTETRPINMKVVWVMKCW